MSWAASGARRRRRKSFVVTSLAAFWLTVGNMVLAKVDVMSLWDFQHPDVSEQRFRAALVSAEGDDALILQTQIARTYGLRQEFANAQAVLNEVAPTITSAGPLAQAYYQLELGRTYSSATHPSESQTPEAKEKARAAYTKALEIAQSSHLDMLAIDAIHMMAFIDTEPVDQLKWAREALAVVLASSQPDAKRWEASIRNNIGYALFQLNHFDEALEEFRRAVVLREQRNDAEATRGAYFMVAMTLRAMNKLDEALTIQLRLERESATSEDADVFAELEKIYRAKGDKERADRYLVLWKSASGHD